MVVTHERCRTWSEGDIKMSESVAIVTGPARASARRQPSPSRAMFRRWFWLRATRPIWSARH